MVPLLCILLVTAQASAAYLYTSGPRRTQLLERYLGAAVPPARTMPVSLQSSLRRLHEADVTSTQALAAQDEPEQPKRALKMAFYNRLDGTRSKSEKDYIMNKLIPATAAILARSMRVCRLPLPTLPVCPSLRPLTRACPPSTRCCVLCTCSVHATPKGRAISAPPPPRIHLVTLYT